jgi:hypothetical protein
MTGILLNVPVSSLGNYRVCMDVPYSDVSSQDKLAACANDPSQYVAVGAKQAGSSTLALVAVARASEAFSQHCDARSANGAYWYNCAGKSFGFAPTSSVSLGSADTASDQCASRLSWHMDGSSGGYRAGCTTDLNSASSYYKQIYILSGCKGTAWQGRVESGVRGSAWKEALPSVRWIQLVMHIFYLVVVAMWLLFIVWVVKNINADNERE